MLDWLYTAIAFVLKSWHSLYSTFLEPDLGLTWVLSIIFLVITVRIIIFPLFKKQVKSQRAMQDLQPEIAKLKEKHGKDRQTFSQEVMKLQKERGVNPLAGCFPILLQMPVFISLLHVLRRLAPGKDGLYSWSDALTNSAASANVFGAPISSSFTMPEGKLNTLLALPGVSEQSIKIVTFTLILVMCVTQFVTQRQIMKKSGPVEGQAAMIQKLILYGAPIGLFVGGFFFPLGVLLYWFTNNLWTMGQQFYILKKMPPKGSPAALAREQAEKPVIDPKALAPKPGAKPTQPKNKRPTPAPAEEAKPETSEDKTSLKKPAASSGGGKPGDGASTPKAGGASRPSANGTPASRRSKSTAGRRPPARKKRR